MLRVPGAALRAGFMTGLPRFARNDGGVNDGVFAVLERVPRILGGLPCTAPFVLSLSKDEREPRR